MKATQCEMILDHIRQHGSITALEAMDLYGCMRLGSRINDLRRNGVPIKTEYISGKNRYGRSVTFARYTLGTIRA